MKTRQIYIICWSKNAVKNIHVKLEYEADT